MKFFYVCADVVAYAVLKKKEAYFKSFHFLNIKISINKSSQIVLFSIVIDLYYQYRFYIYKFIRSLG